MTAEWVCVSFWDDENVIKLIARMVVQLLTVHFKSVSCMVCKLYLKKAFYTESNVRWSNTLVKAD